MLFAALILGCLSQSTSQLVSASREEGKWFAKCSRKASLTSTTQIRQIASACICDQIISPVFLSFPCNGTGCGFPAEKTQLIQAREIRMQRRFTKHTQSREGKATELFFRFPVQCTLHWHRSFLMVFRYLKGMTELTNCFSFRPLAARIRRCTVFFCLSLPGFLVRKSPKEIGAYLEINVLLDMWNVHREQTTIPPKKGTFYRSAGSGISKDKGV